MLFVYLLAISFLFFFGVLNGQHLQLNTTTFDVSGCADPLGTYECYLSASSVWQNISAKCNQTDAVCLQAQRTIYQMDTLGCMAADCWNQALTCEYGFMTLAFFQEQVDGYLLGTNYPPFVHINPHNVPGACVCDIPVAFTWVYDSPTLECALIKDEFVDICECCVYARNLAALQSLCPDSSLDDISITDYVANAQSAISVKSNCSFMSASNWLDTASGNCPGLRIKPTGAAGYLNPLSLPPNFPGTAALSNYPSSVTSITQYLGYTGTALVQSWTENYVQTYALASGGDIGVAAISTGLATSIAMSTTTLITPTGQNPPNRVSVGVWPDLPSGISPSSSPSLSTSRTTTPTTTAAASTIAVPTHAPKSSSNRLSVNARVLIVLLMSGMALV